MREGQMQLGVSIYPGLGGDVERGEIERYLDAAARLGYREAFTSVHVPEQGFDEQVANVQWLSGMAHVRGMTFVADISGNELPAALQNAAFVQAMQGDCFLRLDYAVGEDIVQAAVRDHGIYGFVLNASVPDAREVHRWRALFDTLPGTRVRACHNFYPRAETGLSKAFMLEKTRLYDDWGIPVTCCIASHTNPRAPLREGLPTVEAHRRLTPYRAAMELAAEDCIGGILIGDPFASEDELVQVARACSAEPIALRVRLAPGLSPEERRIVTMAAHHARPDQAVCSLRSQSSREMACFGASIPPQNCTVRARGAVTIDNANYGRYSGELQVILCDLPADPRVNVAAQVIPEDEWLLDFVAPSRDFVLLDAEAPDGLRQAPRE